MRKQPATDMAISTNNSTSNSINTAATRQLLRLNTDFLKLMIGTAAGEAISLRRYLGLADAQMNLLLSCSDDALLRMAGCSFALFSLSLHQVALWQRCALSDQRLSELQHYQFPAPTQDFEWRCIHHGFMECALFFAWHLAQTQPNEARQMLGMSEECARVLAHLELRQCRHLALDNKLLAPRWRQHPYFWSDLLRYGSSSETQHFKLVCVLASQLTAQDLEPSTILRLSQI
ncbi:MAG: hypothetical protein QM808_09425 [Steroidobacteraceae bacterium]